MEYKNYLKKNKDLIAMIHVKAMPGTPRNKLSSKRIIKKAIKEAKRYKKLGIKTVMIENMHDIPYTKEIDHGIVSIMSIIGSKIKDLGLNCGIQILSSGNKEALAVAKAADLDFIRCENFIYAHIGDEGYTESCAGELLRYRKNIDAEDIAIFTDIKKKHSSHSITSDVDLKEAVDTANFFLTDGIIITGRSTGKPAEVNDLKSIKNSQCIKLIGSGITAENIDKYYNLANAFIVGSYFKKKGNWKNKLSTRRIKKLINKFNKLR